jgi:predicted nuclease with TOPRIM domain
MATPPASNLEENLEAPMTDTTLLEKLERLTRTVERLENRVEELEDQRHLESAIIENAGKKLVSWEQAVQLLDLH